MTAHRRALLIWAGLAAAIAVPIAVAASSPLLQWRGPVYIAACLAGVAAMSVILLQPLLAAGALPGLPPRRGRRLHRWTGAALLTLVVVHVGGLWITSPPDVVDALLFTSATAFSGWGVVAMWALFAAAAVASLRRRLPPRLWRPSHTGLVVLVVAGSVVHALLIEGIMGRLSKLALCVLVLAATAKAVLGLRSWAPLLRRRS